MTRLVLDTWILLLLAFLVGSALAYLFHRSTKGARR